MENIPANREAERSLVATLSLFPEFWKYAQHLTAEHFFDLYSKEAFQQMLKLSAEGRPWLPLDKDCESWQSLSLGVGTLEHFQETVSRIQEAYICRMAYKAAQNLAIAAIHLDANNVERALTGIKLPSMGSEGESAEDIARRLENELGKQEDNIIKCGFSNLDAVKIFWRQEGFGLAARPGMGKSQLASQIGANIVNNGGIVVAWTGEMSAEKWVTRVVNTYAGTSYRYAQSDDLRFVGAFMKMEGLGKYIIFEQRMKSLEFTSQCRRIADKYGRLDLAIVDHIGIMADEHDEERHRLGHITHNLRELAKELDCCTLMCIHLRRLGQRADMRPTLEDLRDSGEIEQNLDVASFLYRDAYYKAEDPNKQSGPAEFYTRKNRDGRQWSKQLYFDAEHGPRFAVLETML